MNGYRVVASADDAERFLVDEVIGAHAELETIARWLAARTVDVVGRSGR